MCRNWSLETVWTSELMNMEQIKFNYVYYDKEYK